MFIAAALATPAAAFDSNCNSSGVRSPSGQLIRPGDSIERLVKAFGEPREKHDLINAFGVKLGEEWRYSSYAKNFAIRINARGVTQACQFRKP